jgi:hypothetical protein
LGLALDIGDKEIVSILAEKTVASLEDAKQQLSAGLNGLAITDFCRSP